MPSGNGERAAISGYQPQYEVAASMILHHLRRGTLEWIKLADPDAETMDDFQIATPGRLDAYQVKWSQYSSNVTYRSFITSSRDNEAPLIQLVKGWKVLCNSNPERQVVVHWLTNDQASPNDGVTIPVNDTKPTPCHFAAFLEQVLFPITEKGKEAPSVSAAFQMHRPAKIEIVQDVAETRVHRRFLPLYGHIPLYVKQPRIGGYFKHPSVSGARFSFAICGRAHKRDYQKKEYADSRGASHHFRWHADLLSFD